MRASSCGPLKDFFDHLDLIILTSWSCGACKKEWYEINEKIKEIKSRMDFVNKQYNLLMLNTEDLVLQAALIYSFSLVLFSVIHTLTSKIKKKGLLFGLRRFMWTQSQRIKLPPWQQHVWGYIETNLPPSFCDLETAK